VIKFHNLFALRRIRAIFNMRTAILTVAAALLASNSFALPIIPTAEEAQDSSIDFTIEGSTTSAQPNSAAVELSPDAKPTS
jgi:hypothetical protein